MEVLFLLMALAGAALAGRERLKSRRLLRRLDQMLEQAAGGSFREEAFNEGLLSALESRMARYLASSSLSQEAMAREKANIQSLLTDISHQIKTPAANMLLYAQLLNEQPLTQEGRACAAALEGQAEKLRTLTDILSKLSRLETGILTLHPVPGPLEPMLEDAAAQFALRAAEKDITLTLVPAGARAVFDPKWTAEAVCNLLDNAVKYTPPGGSVTVDTVAYEMFGCVRVSDTGPGIPEEEQAKIFQRFYRAPSAHDQEGVGVGLYLAREIARGQGGYLKVKSPEDGGAVFSLFLPGG